MSKMAERKSIMDEFATIEKEVEYIRSLESATDVELRELLSETRPMWEKEEYDVHPDEAAFYQDALYHRHA